MKVCVPCFLFLLFLSGLLVVPHRVEARSVTGLGSGPPPLSPLPPVGHEDESGWRTFSLLLLFCFLSHYFDFRQPLVAWREAGLNLPELKWLLVVVCAMLANVSSLTNNTLTSSWGGVNNNKKSRLVAHVVWAGFSSLKGSVCFGWCTGWCNVNGGRRCPL